MLMLQEELVIEMPHECTTPIYLMDHCILNKHLNTIGIASSPTYLGVYMLHANVMSYENYIPRQYGKYIPTSSSVVSI